jgi:hypothetical protein
MVDSDEDVEHREPELMICHPEGWEGLPQVVVAGPLVRYLSVRFTFERSFIFTTGHW